GALRLVELAHVEDELDVEVPVAVLALDAGGRDADDGGEVVPEAAAQDVVGRQRRARGKRDLQELAGGEDALGVTTSDADLRTAFVAGDVHRLALSFGPQRAGSLLVGIRRLTHAPDRGTA